MRCERRSNSPYERIQAELERERVETMQSIQDYNIMMGILEDPAAEDEEEEDEEDE